MKRARILWVFLTLPIAPSLLAEPTAPDALLAVCVTIPPAWPPSEGQTLHSSHQWPNRETGDTLAPGDLVVLLEDNPAACPELRAGQAGTIVCRGGPARSGEFLVSWISYNDDVGGAGACGATEPAIFPPGSAVWIDPNEALLGRPFDQCGTLRKTPEGCILLEAETGHVYNLPPAGELCQTLDTTSEIQYGDRVRVRGLVSTTPPGPDAVRICPQQADGDIHHPIITLATTAEEADCCIATLGDRAIQLHRDPEVPNRLLGCTTVTLQLDFRGRLAVEVSPMIGTAGTWQGLAVPELVGPGVASVSILLQAEDIDLSGLPPGNEVPVAEISLVVLPTE